MPQYALAPGQLVKIIAASETVDCPAYWQTKYPSLVDNAHDAVGHRGQLLEWNADVCRWLVATFDGTMIPAQEACLRPLETTETDNVNLILGPASDPEMVGVSFADILQRKGYILSKLLVSLADLKGIVDAANRCVNEGLFSRLPIELEPGYLGRDCHGKIMELGADAAITPYVGSSSLHVVEAAFNAVANALRPFANAEFGFDVCSRSTTLAHFPLVDEDEGSFTARECTNDEASDFLAKMQRATLLVLVNAGPDVATLCLTDKFGDEDETEVLMPPGTLSAFLCDRFRFSFVAPAGTLSLRTWLLDSPRTLGVSDFEGNVASILSASGPPQPDGENITVVSVATRYGLGIDEPKKFWAGLAKAGSDVIVEMPFSRWDMNEYYELDADQSSGKSYTKHGGFSEGVDLFDCGFFDISPAEARMMDPSQRQVMEVSYTALQSAGWDRRTLIAQSQPIGVFVGVDKNEWAVLSKAVGGFAAASSASSILSNRFSFSLNLKGPSMTIDTACSASLVAAHTAKIYLRNTAPEPLAACISTGVNLLISPGPYILCCGAGMLSRRGRCFTYNATADGYARGEGTASICTKLSRWNRERGDLAVQAGSNVNQDGRSASLTAPNGPAQERVNRSVLAEAGITPAEVDAMECHGTGTPLGDPIELGAYKRVMASVHREAPVIVTSAKTNIGHCEGSAGISGFIKCVLISMHAEGTPNCHMVSLNPHIDTTDFPAIFLTENIVTRAAATFSGVLSFGFGGTNACAAVWGQNVVTSRAPSTNVYEALIQRIERAPAPDVMITSENWEEWLTDGPEWDSKPGDSWNLEVDANGAVSYLRKEKVSKVLANSFFLTGTFNGWKHEALEEDSILTGLHKGMITLGRGGEARFQIVANADPALTFCPGFPDCSRKSAPVVGPQLAARESAWYSQGEEGDMFRIEFFQSQSDVFSISWIREQNC
jgi:polyketide synthase-associated protein